MIFNKNFLIGQEFVKRKYITQEQLDEGLIYHQRKNIRLGKALIELGFISDDDLVRVIADQLGIVRVDFQTFTPSEAVLQSIPKEYIKSNTIFPYEKNEDSLTICVVDPLEKNIKDRLEKWFKCEVRLAIATESAIKKAIDTYYDYE
jgi:type IV pilus assembly protein PilB